MNDKSGVCRLRFYLQSVISPHNSFGSAKFLSCFFRVRLLTKTVRNDSIRVQTNTVCPPLADGPPLANINPDTWPGRFYRGANCGRWFLQAPGATFAYCAGPAPEDPGKTCREIGATSSFRSKVENNDVWKVHQRAYKKYFARIRSGLMTKSEFEVWSRQAADLRDAALERYARAESEEECQRIAQEVAEALNEA